MVYWEFDVIRVLFRYKIREKNCIFVPMKDTLERSFRRESWRGIGVMCIFAL